jgi:hypothetical protein
MDTVSFTSERNNISLLGINNNNNNNNNNKNKKYIFLFSDKEGNP